jgi:FixJ family two-component response regulator
MVCEKMEEEYTDAGATHLRQKSTGMVVVVDDDASVRKGLSRLLRSASYNVVVFESVDHFNKSKVVNEAMCIVLDLQMPRTSGLELQAELMAQDYHPPIIFLTGHGDVPSSVTAMKNGAVDFLEKPVDDTLLLAAINRAMKKDSVVRATQARRNGILGRVARLTNREQEVVTHVISGRLNKQIANNLGISEKTVKVHRGRAMGKMRVRSVAELTRLCGEIGLAPVEITRASSVTIDHDIE